MQQQRPNKWNDATRAVYARVASGGVRLSEFEGVQKAAAERLVNRGKLSIRRLADGDYLVYKAS